MGSLAKEAETKCRTAGTFCFSSTTAASGAQEVADLRAPWQKAPDAERGASSGVQATLPGYSDATMLACTPPMLNPHIPAMHAMARMTGSRIAATQSPEQTPQSVCLCSTGCGNVASQDSLWGHSSSRNASHQAQQRLMHIVLLPDQA